jgi:dienelactone hydrolase
LDAKPDDSADAQACLDGLTWKPGPFPVTVKPRGDDGPTAFVRFPSAVPTGNETNDLVALEWYAPRSVDGEILKASAVVVVHESGSRMDVGRLFARALYAKGFHAFLIHLPNYGLRRVKDVDRSDGQRFLPAMKQAIADVRRARDAVAALPEVDADHIAVQGTSLGGFVVATTAGLDRGYDQAFIMVAGGDLLGVINGGRREAAQLRRLLADAGYEGEKLKALASAIEPTRLAHRLDPRTTWLYTAKDDQVVPLASAMALRRAGKLSDEHHIQLWGDHYKVVVYFPVIVEHIVARLREFSEDAADEAE